MNNHLSGFDEEISKKGKSIKANLHITFGMILFYCALFGFQIYLDLPSTGITYWIIGVLIVYACRYAYLMWQLSKL